MRSTLGNACIALLILSISGVVWADAVAPVPEPGVLELVGIGAVAVIVARLARRRK
jgi:hypothetical protein